jgi:hypothetical protein
MAAIGLGVCFFEQEDTSSADIHANKRDKRMEVTKPTYKEATIHGPIEKAKLQLTFNTVQKQKCSAVKLKFMGM